MQRLPAGTRRIARAVARHAMPGLFEATELLHVQVQQLAGAVLLVAAHGDAVLHRRQLGQARLYAHASHRALGDTHSFGDLRVAQALIAAQAFDPLDLVRANARGTAVRARTAILQARDAFELMAPFPARGRACADSGSTGRLTGALGGNVFDQVLAATR